MILISGHADVESTVQGMRQGALTLLQKPFNSQQLMKAVDEAMELSRRRGVEQERLAQYALALSGLSTSDVEIAEMIVSGRTNKQIAALLNFSVRSIEDRRSRLMKHFGVRSIAEFVYTVKPILDARTASP